MKSIPFAQAAFRFSKRLTQASVGTPSKQAAITTPTKTNSALRKLEREIDRVYRSRPRATSPKRRASASSATKKLSYRTAAVLRAAKRYVARVLALLRIAFADCRQRLEEWASASAAYVRSLEFKTQLRTKIIAPSQAMLASFGRQLKSQFSTVRASPSRTAPSRQVANRKHSQRESLLQSMAFWGSLGVAPTCVGLVLLLIVQLRELRSELNVSRSEVGAMKARMISLENARKAAEAPPPEVPLPAAARAPSLMLDASEQRLVRQFIKTLPPKAATQPKIHQGDRIGTSAPVPEPLAEALPKLAGARFTIDENGSIVILGQGSDRADVLIQYQ